MVASRAVHRVRRVGALVAVVAAALLAGGCAHNDGRQLRPPPAGATAPTPTTLKAEPAPGGSAFSLSSSAFTNGGQLPDPRTCSGAGDPPPLAWTDPLAAVAEFALVAKDLDESGTIHWVVGAISADVRALAPGAPPVGAIDFGYQAPCPQPGDPTHVYAFTLYGLSTPIALTATMSPAQAASMIESQPAQAAQLTAFYGR